jgi:hypothetical protein
MGSRRLGGECEIAHIGGAKTIQSAIERAAEFRRTAARRVRMDFGRRSLRRGNAP